MSYYKINMASGKQIIVKAKSVDEAKKDAEVQKEFEGSADDILEVIFLSILENDN